MFTVEVGGAHVENVGLNRGVPQFLRETTVGWVYTCATHQETQKRLLLTILHRWSMHDQESEPWRAKTSLRAVQVMRWCYTGNLCHTPCK